jgi:hypothetical protein
MKWKSRDGVLAGSELNHTFISAIAREIIWNESKIWTSTGLKMHGREKRRSGDKK